MEAESEVQEILLVCRGLELEKADKNIQDANIELQNILGCKGPTKNQVQLLVLHRTIPRITSGA